MPRLDPAVVERPPRGLEASLEAPGGLSPTATRAEALARLRRAFTEAGLDTPALDARILVTEALGIGATELALRPEALLGGQAARLAAWAARRLAREPVSRILGQREFWGLPFMLSPATLVPRPDSETVVETALALVSDRGAPLRLLDLGTGSGCLVVALLHELPGATGLGVDRSFEALSAARANAEANGVGGRARFVASDWASALRGRFDLIVSNPPYIPSGDIAGLDPEVRAHDPPAALDGGSDGLSAYRVILGEADRLLSPAGVLVVEIGVRQAEDLGRLAVEAGLRVLRVSSDLGGQLRAVALERLRGS